MTTDIRAAKTREPSPRRGLRRQSERISAYPRNSPRAAARILALTLIANGRMQASELAALEANDANAQLGITDREWHDVLRDLCVALLATPRQGKQCLIDARLIEQMLGEIDDVALQRRVLRLCSAVVHADGEIDDGESVVLLMVIDRWELHPQEQPLLEPLLYGMDFQVAPRRQVGPPRAAVVPRALLARGCVANPHLD